MNESVDSDSWCDPQLRKIMTYTSSRVATVQSPFSTGATSNLNQYTITGCLSGLPPLGCPNCPRIVRADVVDNGDSTYTATFTGTQKGLYTVVTSLVNAGGLVSTYYDSLASLNPVPAINFGAAAAGARASRVDMTVDWSTATTGVSKPSATLTSAATFGVRWMGFVRPSKAQQYTFAVVMPQSATATQVERVKLWVDNSIIVSQWNSLASTNPSGTIGFGRGNGYYDISALYKCTVAASGSCAYSLFWQSTTTGVAAADTQYARIPSTRLFQRLDVPNGPPSGHRLQPAVACASTSSAAGAGLTLATAGYGASFTIQSRDAYENTREDVLPSFSATLIGSGGTPVYAGAVASLPPTTLGQYVASYTVQSAKSYDVFVKYGTDNIKGSPFSATVLPASTCGPSAPAPGLDAPAGRGGGAGTAQMERGRVWRARERAGREGGERGRGERAGREGARSCGAHPRARGRAGMWRVRRRECHTWAGGGGGGGGGGGTTSSVYGCRLGIFFLCGRRLHTPCVGVNSAPCHCPAGTTSTVYGWGLTASSVSPSKSPFTIQVTQERRLCVSRCWLARASRGPDDQARSPSKGALS